MLQLKSKKKIYLYLIFLLILSTISNNNFSNFFKKTFKIKEIRVSGLSDIQNKKIQEKIKKLNYINIFSVEKDRIAKIMDSNFIFQLSSNVTGMSQPSKIYCTFFYEWKSRNYCHTIVTLLPSGNEVREANF